MRFPDLLHGIEASIEDLFRKDKVLFSFGTSGIVEQTLTFRLGLYLQSRFPNHSVDCEYNRIMGDPKSDPQVDQKWMMPDIIVHKRKISEHNLFVVEAKKARLWNKGIGKVTSKLEAFTRDEGRYRYSLGLAWKIVPSDKPQLHLAQWFIGGEKIAETTLAGFSAPLQRAYSRRGTPNET